MAMGKNHKNNKPGRGKGFKSKNSKNDRKGINKKRKDIKKKNDGGKRTFCFNRYRDKNVAEELLKQKKLQEDKLKEKNESSESEEEFENPIEQLMSTFSKKDTKASAVDSSDESEEDIKSEDEGMEFSDESENSDDVLEENIPETIEKVTEVATKSKLNILDVDETELTENDSFTKHLRDDIHESLLKSVTSIPQTLNTAQLNWPCLGKIVVQIPISSPESEEKIKTKFTLLEDKVYAKSGVIPDRISNVNLDQVHIRKQLQPFIAAANKVNLCRKECELSEVLTPLQREMFSIINNYQDFYYPHRAFSNGEEIRFVYCLHVLNHILKTRTKILHHNAKLTKKDELSDECRDQGLVRPKVLIIVPFRDSAYRIINTFIELLVPDDPTKVINKNRFEEDFTGNALLMPKKNPKPEDYELTFAGNSDDTFRIGLSVTKKSLKLFTDFYSSDIIIASPLGLRVIVGAEGEEERDFDFLASIELLVLDQSEIFLMQNWDHLLHIFDHLHLQLKKTHGTDFSRLRSWAINGWTKYYRQNLIFSSVSLPEINSLFNKRCYNYAGKLRVHNPIEIGTIREVAVQVPQVFRKIEVKDPISALDFRFNCFVTDILPQYKDQIMAHTMIYVPSYFDYVRLRNYFKKEEISFVQICEYSKDAKIARARDMFFHTEAHFLLYSERFHFFRRMRIKGIRHIIFYQPPVFPHFYSELCNLLQEANQNKYGGSESNMTVTVLYTKYDLQQLSAIVGSERTAKMAQSDKNIHMFMTGE